MNEVLYTCPFVPAEWIAAHGLTPARISPKPSHTGSSAGVCPFASAFIHAASTTPAIAIIATTVCDQMRHAAEIIESQCDTPVFLMNVPATWRSDSAGDLYRSELLRLGQFLEDMGGSAPTQAKLIQTIMDYDSMRSEIRAKAAGANVNGLPMALAGGPLRSTDSEIFDLVTRAGGTVVLDATAGGEMTLATPIDRTKLAGDPMGQLVDAYFGGVPHAMRRPNNQLYEYLNREITARAVVGLIYRHYQWCDTWHGEAGRLKAELKIPVLYLVAGDDESDRAHVLTRIQAFVEMLK